MYMGSTPRILKILSWMTFVLLLVALYLSLFFAPREATMGDVQRVFYFHISNAWVGMLAFLVAAISGGIYLARGDHRWDRVSLASIEIGIVFAFITIASGSIWARPIWNTWWTWDPRLVTYTVMELIYLAYIMLRQGIEDPDRRARFGSVYGIVAFISVPVTFLSIRLFRTIHPVVVGSGDPGAEGSFDMSSKMLVAFFFSLFTYTFVYAALLWHRIRPQTLAEKLEQLKLKILSS
jgi:heme exporter protein C